MPPSTRGTKLQRCAVPAAAKANDAFSAPGEYEFGGPVGVVFIMLASHAFVYYLWICNQFYQGQLITPMSGEGISRFLTRLWGHIINGASPTWAAAIFYFGYLAQQALCAIFCPGVVVKGLPLPSKNGQQLLYYCNGVYTWYITLALVALLHFTGMMPLYSLCRMHGPLLTVSVLFGDLLSIALYIGAHLFHCTHRMSGNAIYDCFMGAWHNPRAFGGRLDLKIWAETRVSWILLFLVTCSAACEQLETTGSIRLEMWFMVLAHYLYANACMKGEHCIPTTWDIFYEKYGWMLCFWNHAGVPFVYNCQAIYLLRAPVFHHNMISLISMSIILVLAYYIWDTANSQKNYFRMQLAGTYIERGAFPVLPWGVLHHPKMIKTKAGTNLLVDGWWKFVRKPHYTADLVMALLWGLICGFNSFLPYLYFFFFLVVLTHRCRRDMLRCSKKYGADWIKYTHIVPYAFIPGVY